MPTLIVPPSGGTLKSFVESMPNGLRAFLSEGFSALGELESSKLPDLLDLTLDSIERPEQDGLADAGAQSLGVPPHVFPRLFSATGIFVSTLVTREEPAAEILEALVENGLVKQNDRKALQRLAELVEARSEAIRSLFDRASLSREVLPSYYSFDTAVEVRVKIRDGQVVGRVPVLVAHLDTDAQEQEVWLQLTKDQATGMAKKLSKAAEEMEIVEAWLPES